MNFLEERIQKDGIVKEGNILKVDSLLESPDGCSVVSADGRGVPETVCRKANQQDSDH